jgi:hypothetical protein
MNVNLTNRGSEIDHISFEVGSYDHLNFYKETLAMLGSVQYKYFEHENTIIVGFKKDKANQDFNLMTDSTFWISYNMKQPDEVIGKAKGFHVAFKAENIEQINNWYEKCLELGGKDNGKPGPRIHYHPGYYAAFIIDPNGWRIEAVLHSYTK